LVCHWIFDCTPLYYQVEDAEKLVKYHAVQVQERVRKRSSEMCE